MTGRARPLRVVLVREGDSGSGCCGRVPDLCDEPGSAEHYRRTREGMHAAGAVYRALREAFPPERVEVEVVDPRNTAWLVPALLRDARRRGQGGRALLRTLLDGSRQHAVVVGGAVIHRGGVPADPQVVVSAVRRELTEV